jgi:alanyl-tRNA synthetase
MEDEMQEEKDVLDRTVDRRQFTLASAMAILSGVVITISACGGGALSAGTSVRRRDRQDRRHRLEPRHSGTHVTAAGGRGRSPDIRASSRLTR